ncbi:hypothetical protein ACFOJE_12580 [Azotobacter bryophylli]|uniref:Uncharacterized protein n=1 Tax=Azotobacter bryophylli TaxID=1986537 RepID=A0ABV7AV79_9GAMM
MSRSVRSFRKTLDSVAANNESAAIEVMRVVDQVSDQLLRQKLLNVVHQLNRDADDLRVIRDDVPGQALLRA